MGQMADGVDFLDEMAKVTGIPRAESLIILARVRENHRRLEACERHDFVIPKRQIGELVRDWECTRCGGEVSNLDKSWYERGLRDAAKP